MTHLVPDEQILKMDRDIDLINTSNKPPIWVVGTCSFGKYIDNICMAEELMKKDDGTAKIHNDLLLNNTLVQNYLKKLWGK